MCRVGVNSTTMVNAGTTAAVSPMPTIKRNAAKSSHWPFGTRPFSAAPMPQMKVPTTIDVFRPRASENAPNARAPMIEPTPPL